MKKMLWAISLVFLSSYFGFYPPASAEGESSSYDELAQELEKTKEMTQIWKDHVRTLTRERDAAYQEIETLKNQAPPAGSQNRVLRKGEIETQPLANQAAFRDLQRNYQAQTEKLQEVTSQLQLAQSQANQASSDEVSTETQDQIRDLNYQIDRLRYDNERLKIAEKETVDLRSQIDSFRSLKENMRVLQNELDSAKVEKEKAVKEKYALNQQVQSLRSQITASESDLNSVKADRDRISENLRSTRDAQAKRVESIKTGLQSLIQDLNDRQNKS